jgi:hypothetical protein
MNKLLFLSDPSDPDLVPWETVLERLKEFLHLLSTLYFDLIDQLQNLFSGNFVNSDALAIAIPVVLVLYFCAFCCFRAAARGPRLLGTDPDMDGPVYRVKRGGGLFSFHPKRVIV